MGAVDPAYFESLKGFGGVRSYQVLAPPGDDYDARLRLRTDAGLRELLVRQYRSHLSHDAVDHIIAGAAEGEQPLLLVAPHIGSRVAAKLIAAGINYLDAHGNCHISTPPLYIHVEGKTGDERPQVAKGLRKAAYQVLFTYLAEPSLLNAPVRSVAAAAGVSRQPVSDLKRRLLEEGFVLRTKSAIVWHPRRLQDALNLWLHGYQTVVRPSLLFGAYRTEDTEPETLEARVTQGLQRSEFRWGGGAAGFRLTGHYRGERTVVHLPSVSRDLERRLRLLADPAGNLVLMNAFGALNWETGTETVHPLLVYSEMICDGDERSREAAHELYQELLLPLWENEG